MNQHIERQQKQTPAFRAMQDYITGSHGAATEQNVRENVARMRDTEKIAFVELLREREAVLKALNDENPREHARAERVGALKAINLIKKIIAGSADDMPTAT